jgi:hypothetical protein
MVWKKRQSAALHLCGPQQQLTDIAEVAHHGGSILDMALIDEVEHILVQESSGGGGLQARLLPDLLRVEAKGRPSMPANARASLYWNNVNDAPG